MSEDPAGAPARDPGPARRGVVVAVDVGTVRVGVAASDPSGLLASPVATLARDPRGDADLDGLAALVAEREAVEVVVGLPRHLSGREGESVAMARSYAEALAARVAPVPVRLVDERLTTVTAERDLRAAGVAGRARRAVVDQAAAVALLQSVLDGRRPAPLAPPPALPPPAADPAGRGRGARRGRGGARGSRGRRMTQWPP